MTTPSLKTAAEWVEHLELQPHPEGGYFKEVYRSAETIPMAGLPDRFAGPRNYATSIYFLLESHQFSTLHRIQSDEAWHFYAGSAITVHEIHSSGAARQLVIGPDVDNGESFQGVVPAGVWFGAQVLAPNSFALVGCTVAPGFDFVDFEMATQSNLLKEFPEHSELIKQLTRS